MESTGIKLKGWLHLFMSNKIDGLDDKKYFRIITIQILK